MKNLILIISLFLSGCIFQTVNSNDIETAEKICENTNSKIVNITADCLGFEYVMCSNRTTYRLDNK
jgi:hypothetical protein